MMLSMGGVYEVGLGVECVEKKLMLMDEKGVSGVGVRVECVEKKLMLSGEELVERVRVGEVRAAELTNDQVHLVVMMWEMREGAGAS